MTEFIAIGAPIMQKVKITVDNTKCDGCNKCIYVCPVKANVSKLEDGKNKVGVNAEKCILCGKCLKTCDHNARDYEDDTIRFFSDLKQGEKIAVLAAPSVRMNFAGQFPRLFGFLKTSGATGIYDVSFGADITTWAYLKEYENGRKSMISQPCPVIVNYIQKFSPQLIKNLAPVQSPTMCAAIYLREYAGLSDKIAFLSPCISKSSEFCDPNTNGLIEYNVTFAKLEKFLEDRDIDLAQYEKADFDGDRCGLGLLYSRPGGLRENVEFHAGKDVWIKQIEGTTHAKKYLDEYCERDLEGKPVPQLVDILNCEYGCNIGTGTSNQEYADDIDLTMNMLKGQKAQTASDGGDKLFGYFDSKLDVDKFKRSYAAEPVKIENPSDAQIEYVFNNLYKATEDEKNINCFSCGYGSCLEFAKAVARGENHIENCANYSRQVLFHEKEAIVEACKAIKGSIGVINQSNEQNVNEISEIKKSVDILGEEELKIKDSLSSVTKNTEDMNSKTRQLDDIARQTKLIALNALIEAAHAGKYGITFSVVANEIRNLAQNSTSAVEATKSSGNLISGSVNSTSKMFDNIDSMVEEIDTNINYMSGHIVDVDEKCKNVCKELDILLGKGIK